MENPPMKEQYLCLPEALQDSASPETWCHYANAEDESLRPWYVKIFQDWIVIVWIATGGLLIGLFAPQEAVDTSIKKFNRWLR